MAQLLAPNDLLARVRRDVDRSVLRARNGLKHLSGVDRPALGVTPKDTVWKGEKVELWRYHSDHRTVRPPVLLVHSLVSRSYVLDLSPGNSFVEFLLARGFDVYLIDWGVPDELEAGNDLETYCDGYLPELVRVVTKESGSPTVTVFGYCFGGVLSLLYAAGHPDDPIANLASIATPIDMSKLGPMTALLQDGRVEADDLIGPSGNVPAEVMLNSFRVLQPTGDLSGYANLWQNLWNDEFVGAYQAMTQWSRDHIPFPGAAFRQMAELLTRQNLLTTGAVPLGGRTVELADIRVPFLSVVGEKDNIVPPESSAPLPSLVGSADSQELRLPAGHVGLFVGRSAQKRTLPAMADWLERHAEAQ